MLYSSTTSGMVDVYGLERGLELMMDAGFPAIDLNLGDNNEYLFREDWRETADRIKMLADRRGVVFNQAHAPFGGEIADGKLYGRGTADGLAHPAAAQISAITPSATIAP